ncbi:hypothetical protein BKA70DRAFT_1445709 [Coprinopsis sp. MPI-PUGE-AT-0042]|nr:hypothetical protein BKA70DRAFT_1445709 [Coprinopsis sp. MPI-PUGE-AT-0042]
MVLNDREPDIELRLNSTFILDDDFDYLDLPFVLDDAFYSFAPRYPLLSLSWRSVAFLLLFTFTSLALIMPPRDDTLGGFHPKNIGVPNLPKGLNWVADKRIITYKGLDGYSQILSVAQLAIYINFSNSLVDKTSIDNVNYIPVGYQEFTDFMNTLGHKYQLAYIAEDDGKFVTPDVPVPRSFIHIPDYNSYGHLIDPCFEQDNTYHHHSDIVVSSAYWSALKSAMARQFTSAARYSAKRSRPAETMFTAALPAAKKPKTKKSKPCKDDKENENKEDPVPEDSTMDDIPVASTSGAAA